MTNLYILTQDLLPIGVVDEFESLIWTQRFQEPGDFELVLPVKWEYLELFQNERYVRYEDDPELMIIETIEISTDSETGQHLYIKGRTVSSVLDRRVVYPMVYFKSYRPVAAIQLVLSKHVINPTDENRAWDQLIFSDKTDPDEVDFNISAQYTGDTVLAVVTDLCLASDIGYRILWDGDRGFIFMLYTGVDVSGEVPTFQTVVFSPSYDNLNNSRYTSTTRDWKTVAVVAGEGEGNDRKNTTVVSPEYSIFNKGLDRRELFVDARDISSSVPGTDTPISSTEYTELLKQRGIEKLSELRMADIFDGEANPNQMFTYGKDFFLGDIVRIENEYGMSGRSRVVEYIRSEGSTGKTEYPMFEHI